MILKQTLSHTVDDCWGGSKEQVFNWVINGQPCQNNKGRFVRIGCWALNHWFYVAQGKTEKQTLSYAKQHLRATTRIASTFEYID